MLGIRTLKNIIFGVDRFQSSSMTESKTDDLCYEGLTMGTLYIGKQGTGKTTSLARHLVEYMKRYPNRAIFIIDWSGSITNTLIKIILSEEQSTKDRLLKRIIYDQLGNEDYVVPMPEFSLAYGGTYETQVQRVTRNFQSLDPELVTGAPLLGGIAIRDIAPQFYRLVTAISNDGVDAKETWQITEVKKLILDRVLLRKILERYGSRIPDTARFLRDEYLNNEIKAGEKEMRTYAMRSILNITDIRGVRARLGYPTPGWTPKEAIATGKMVIVDGAKLIGQSQTQSYLFTQVFSLIMQEINRRIPDDPKDNHVSLVLDEVYSLFTIPGMAQEVFRLAPQYRSRKLQVYIVLQNLAQIHEKFQDQVWGLGNSVIFSLSNFREAYEVAQQLFKYEPRKEKLPAVNDNSNPLMETDRGQYLETANWIQNLPNRSCIIRRHIQEAKLDKKLHYIPETTSIDINVSFQEIESAKDELLRQRAIPIREALENINSRQIVESQTRPTIDL